MTRDGLAIGLACVVCALLCGCRQVAARLELSDRRPDPAAEAPIVRVVPTPTDDRRTVAATHQHRTPTPQTEEFTSADETPDADVADLPAQLHDSNRLQPGADRSDVVSVAFREQANRPADDDDVRHALQVPRELPGAGAPELRLPSYNPHQPLDERREAIRELYRALPDLPPELVVGPESGERPLTLAELQQTAYSRSPVINRAWAAVDAVRGRAVQAGLCPNPVVGYEGDTINTLNTAGYNGVYFEQTYVTAGKLGWAQQAALMEVRAAEYAYRRARIEVATAIRDAYFGALIAQERVRLTRAMSLLTQDAYDAQVELVAGGEAAAYEPLQLRVSALKARNDVVAAENSYQASWRELAAALNDVNMRPAALAGSVETPPADLQFEVANSAMLRRHTDLSIAQAEIAQQQFNLQLQRVTPIPNLELYSAILHDDTNSRNNVSYNVQVGLPLPIFNRNQGNIAAANAELIRAQHNLVSTQNSLSAQLAEAFARYATARELAETYRTEIVPSQVQTFRGVYTQFRAAGQTDFAQVIVSQQTLSQVVGEYLNTLSNEWNAAVDVAEILQVEDIYTMDGFAMPPKLEPVPAE